MDGIFLGMLLWVGQMISTILLVKPIRNKISSSAHQNIARHCTVSEPQFNTWGRRSIRVSIRLENHSFAEVSIQRIEGFIGQDSREFPIGSFSASAISYVPDRQTTLSRHPPDNQITIHANITPDALF